MGLRPGDSMFLIDGLNMYEWGQGAQLLNGYAPAGDAATILPIDAIQDFNIQQDPKAEVGWKPGVAINMGLKSGTNSYPRHAPTPLGVTAPGTRKTSSSRPRPSRYPRCRSSNTAPRPADPS